MPYPDLRAEAAIKRLRHLVGAIRVESPIEAKFYPWLVAWVERQGCYVRSQYRLDRFRYDFAIFAPGGDLIALVECDGKASHKKRRARKRDTEKNNKARAIHCPLFRFTGSQIWNDPEGCAVSMGDRTKWSWRA